MSGAKWEKQTTWPRGSEADFGCALSFNNARCSSRGAEGHSFDTYHFLSGCAPLTALISGPFRSRLKRSISSLQGPPPLLLLIPQRRSSPCSLPAWMLCARHGDDPWCEMSLLREPSDSSGMGAWQSVVLGVWSDGHTGPCFGDAVSWQVLGWRCGRCGVSPFLESSYPPAGGFSAWGASWAPALHSLRMVSSGFCPCGAGVCCVMKCWCCISMFQQLGETLGVAAHGGNHA